MKGLALAQTQNTSPKEKPWAYTPNYIDKEWPFHTLSEQTTCFLIKYNFINLSICPDKCLQLLNVRRGKCSTSSLQVRHTKVSTRFRFRFKRHSLHIHSRFRFVFRFKMRVSDSFQIRSDSFQIRFRFNIDFRIHYRDSVEIS